MVLTTTAPALVAASQQATSAGLFGGADEDAVAGLDAEILDQRVGDPVGPVRQFLVGPAAAIADQRDVVAEAARHQAVGQFDAGVELVGIVETAESEFPATATAAEDCRARKCRYVPYGQVLA